MATVIVIGGGMGGLAAAARLAKLGHTVTLHERTDRLGGAVRRVEQDGVGWDLGPATMTLPAAIRDLFRKSGRPLERVLDLVPVESPRRHVLPDGTVLDLPLTSRSGQRDALAEVFGARTADAWTGLVDGLSPLWELLRQRAVEVPYAGHRSLGWRGLLRVAPWRSFDAVAAALPDPRARAVFAVTALGPGADTSRTPGFLAVQAYVERTFGRWTCVGGLTPLVAALEHRLAERRVTVRLGSTVTGIDADADRVTGVRLADGARVPADVVVSTVPVADLLHQPPPRLRRVTELRERPRVPVVGVGLEHPVEPQPFETVHHREHVVVRAEREASTSALTVLSYGAHEDPTAVLGDLAAGVRVRHATEGGGAGPVWDGAKTFDRLAPTVTSIGGLFCVGPWARPGPGLPYVLLGAASAAGAIGPA